MIGKTSSILLLRWLLLLLLSLLWATMGNASSLAEHGEFGQCTLAAKTLPPLRQQYVDEVTGLADLGLVSRAAGADAEATARLLSAERDALKLKYRALSPPEKVAEWEARAMEKWGNPLGPTVDQLRAAGKSWDDIIESAARPSGADVGF